MKLRYGILDSSYTNREYQSVAASWIRWRAAQLGVEIVEVEDCDVVLITAISPDTATSIRSRLRRGKLMDKPRVLGGAGALSPVVFDDLADVMCIGEGRRFLDVLFTKGLDAAAVLPEAWVPGEDRLVVPSADFPWELPPVMHPDGKYRVFESRGCKHKCLFCQTGWARRYFQNPKMGRLLRQCRELERRGLPYDLVVNDGGHTGFSEKLKGNRMLSINFRALLRTPLSKMPRTVRIGVEGVSERIRRAIGKPIPLDGLVELSKRLMEGGKTVKLFYIMGFPLETSEDYDELFQFIEGVSHAEKGQVQMGLHGFIPESAAPLCIFPLEDAYREHYTKYVDGFLDGDIFTRRVSFVRPAGYPGRLKKSLPSMGATEEELRRGWWFVDNPNWRVQYVAPPWKMRHMAAAYARKMSRPDAIPKGVIIRPDGSTT